MLLTNLCCAWPVLPCFPARWTREDFPWSQELQQRNREMFGNSKFRLNQLQIMNATLSGRDVFVLMPTGVLLERT